MGSLRVEHDWATSLSLFTFCFHALEKEMATHSSVSCLENPRDGGAQWAAVYGVTQSPPWLKWLSSSSSIFIHKHSETYKYTFMQIYTLSQTHWHIQHTHQPNPHTHTHPPLCSTAVGGVTMVLHSRQPWLFCLYTVLKNRGEDLLFPERYRILWVPCQWPLFLRIETKD